MTTASLEFKASVRSVVPKAAGRIDTPPCVTAVIVVAAK